MPNPVPIICLGLLLFGSPVTPPTNAASDILSERLLSTGGTLHFEAWYYYSVGVSQLEGSVWRTDTGFRYSYTFTSACSGVERTVVAAQIDRDAIERLVTAESALERHPVSAQPRLRGEEVWLHLCYGDEERSFFARAGEQTTLVRAYLSPFYP